MAIETFKWATPAGASGSPTFDVLAAKFGDGYQQTAENGLNNKHSAWALTFTGTEDYIQAIADFLDRQKGARSFYWRAPLTGQVLVKASKYSPVHKGGNVYSLSVTFEQDFKP